MENDKPASFSRGMILLMFHCHRPLRRNLLGHGIALFTIRTYALFPAACGFPSDARGGSPPDRGFRVDRGDLQVRPRRSQFGLPALVGISGRFRIPGGIRLLHDPYPKLQTLPCRHLRLCHTRGSRFSRMARRRRSSDDPDPYCGGSHRRRRLFDHFLRPEILTVGNPLRPGTDPFLLQLSEPGGKTLKPFFESLLAVGVTDPEPVLPFKTFPGNQESPVHSEKADAKLL